MSVIFTLTLDSFASAVDFDSDIQPILQDHCFKCHSGPKAKRKIRYDEKRYLKEVIGTHSEAVIVPGSPEKSLLIKLASLPQTDTSAMPPPRRGEPLNSAELALIRKWIAEGANLESDSSSAPTTTMADRNTIHTWTNEKGKTLRAAFIGVEGHNVKLRKEDGEEISYPISMLSDESQKLARELYQ